MKAPLSKFELLLLALLVAGVVFTYRDYRRWHNQEMGQYGQGPTTNQPIAPSLPLDGRYQNVLVRLRLAYPLTWKVVENPATANPKHPPIITNQVEIVHFDAKPGVSVKVTAEKISRNLVDEVDSLAKKITPSREREYISTDKTNLTVLTWIVGTNTYQAAYAKPTNNIMYSITAVAPTAEWATYEKTFWAMFSSLIPL